LPEAIRDGQPALRASDVAYEEIRSRVLDLRLWPGETVDERRLAAELGLGRTPVREALLRLGADQLLRVLPHRGFLVPPIGLGEVRDLFEARMAVECGIARLAASHADDGDLARFRELVEEAEPPTPHADFEDYLVKDQAVHSFLGMMARNGLLRDAQAKILQQNIRCWRYYFAERGFTTTSVVTHRPLAKALAGGDPGLAGRAMAEHVEKSRLLLHSLF